MNKEDFLKKLFNDVLLSKNDKDFYIVCCFNKYLDYNVAVKNLLDTFFFQRRSEITVYNHLDYCHIQYLKIHIYLFMDGCFYPEGINPNQLYIESGSYLSSVYEVFKYKTSAIKDSEIFYFEGN